MASADLQNHLSPQIIHHLQASPINAEALFPASPCYAKAFEHSEVATFEPLGHNHTGTEAPETQHLLRSSLNILQAMPGSDMEPAITAPLPRVVQPLPAFEEGGDGLPEGTRLPLPQPIILPDEMELQEKGQLAQYFGVTFQPDRCSMMLPLPSTRTRLPSPDTAIIILSINSFLCQWAITTCK